MTILQKDYIVSVTPGTTGVEGTPGTPDTPGYWTTEVIPGTNVASPTIRLATWAEVLKIWPNLETNCDVQIYILTAIKTSYYGGVPIAYLNSSEFITINFIYDGIALCVMSSTMQQFENPSYEAGWTYAGEISGCPAE